MDDELKAYASTLFEEIDEAVTSDDQDGDTHEEAFTTRVLAHFNDIGLSPDAVSCYYERPRPRKSMKINGFSADEERGKLDIFVTLYFPGGQIEILPKAVIEKARKWGYNFFLGVEKGLRKETEPSRPSHDMITKIEEFQKQEPRIRLFVLTNGRTNAVKNGSLTTTKSNREIEFQIWDIERLFRSMSAQNPKEEIVIDFHERFDTGLPCLPMPIEADRYTSYLTIVPGEWLYQLYDTFGAGLLEFNVRSFLQISGKVNRGIRNTLRSDPESFLAYNNGLSVTVDQMELEVVDGVTHIKSVQGMQIVNGGQTTVSIYRAKKKDKADLDRVQVPVKFTCVKEGYLEDMVPKISEYANSQNPVNITDFSSNDPFHIQVQYLSRNTWMPGEEGKWFYERARGQYKEELDRKGYTPAQLKQITKIYPTKRKLSKTDIARFLQTWNQKPYQVSYGSQKNFVYFQNDLHAQEEGNEPFSPDVAWYKDMIAKGILYKKAAQIVRRADFPAYRANITCYLVSYLSYRVGRQLDMAVIWAQQDISPELCEVLETWAPDIRQALLDSARGRNITEWCKKPECWKAVQELILPLEPEALPEWRQELPRETADQPDQQAGAF